MPVSIVSGTGPEPDPRTSITVPVTVVVTDCCINLGADPSECGHVGGPVDPDAPSPPVREWKPGEPWPGDPA